MKFKFVVSLALLFAAATTTKICLTLVSRDNARNPDPLREWELIRAPMGSWLLQVTFTMVWHPVRPDATQADHRSISSL